MELRRCRANDGKLVDLSRLKRLANVHFLGPRSRQELPSYLKGFDVCTIPYVCDKLAESIFPLKLFEYLAAGRPIVTTALPELLPFREYIRIGNTDEEFLSALGTSLTNPLPQVSEAFLTANSWDSKADQLWTIVTGRLNQDIP
jgi:glycosyltransferase involved in cell wall biosynthesis